MIEVGIKGKESVEVTTENTAATLGSGLLEVFATPAMIALMECTSKNSIAEYLDDGQGTVGTSLDVKHLSATPVGMTVTCISEVTAVDGRKITFKVEAFDDAGLIGEGTHQRFIIDNEKFMKKAQGKLK